MAAGIAPRPPAAIQIVGPFNPLKSIPDGTHTKCLKVLARNCGSLLGTLNYSRNLKDVDEK